MGRPDPADALAAAGHLDALAAEPRPAGGAAEARARAYCSAQLSSLGFRVREEAFEYSAFPGRWATPIGGLVSGLTLAAAAALGALGRPGLALAALLSALLALALGGTWAARRGVLVLPWLRERSANLAAERGAPRVWLVAHLDSKSQPVPMVARVAGIIGTALAWVAAIALAVSHALRDAPTPTGAWVLVGAAGVLASVPVMASLVGAGSPGAVDDASGVATVLLAAAWVPSDLPLGVLLTSAEELGLAGARAWAVGRPRSVALNVDGVDDVGDLRWMTSDQRGVALARRLGGAPATRLVAGVLVDAVALADAGWTAVTLSKGTLGTLRRIHTAADSRDRLRGEGVAEGGRVLAAAAMRLARERMG